MNLQHQNTARILIIEDQKPNVDLLLDFFEMNNYQFVEAITDPRLAEDKICSIQPDILLLDLGMPYVSGFDILEKLKCIIPPDEYLPVLVLTADITLESKRKALRMGAGDFLTKPFDLLELQARVNTHLQIRFKNKEIKEFADKQKELIAIKDKFFSIIAHDVRNPFAGIVNFSKIILAKFDDFSPEQLKESLTTINKTAQHGRDLLENLLKWSQTQTNITQVNINSVFLNKCLNNLVETFAVQAENKKIHLKLEIESEIVLETDVEMLDTILRNLISNAIKFTPKMGQVIISACEIGDFVEISVSDTGIGISTDVVEKLFYIDQKLNSRNGTDDERGSGLGLILCREFTDKLKGELIVESKVNEGTKFTLRLTVDNN